jgi:hypothetical protein
MKSLAQLDETMHDPLQTHIDEFRRGARGPYPEHPFDGE